MFDNFRLFSKSNNVYRNKTRIWWLLFSIKLKRNSRNSPFQSEFDSDWGGERTFLKLNNTFQLYFNKLWTPYSIDPIRLHNYTRVKVIQVQKNGLNLTFWKQNTQLLLIVRWDWEKWEISSNENKVYSYIIWEWDILWTWNCYHSILNSYTLFVQLLYIILLCLKWTEKNNLQ